MIVAEHRMQAVMAPPVSLRWHHAAHFIEERAPSSDDYYFCGTCGILLVRRVSLAGIQDVLVCCTNCGTYNTPVEHVGSGKAPN